MTAEQFVQKWAAIELSERAASQEKCKGDITDYPRSFSETRLASSSFFSFGQCRPAPC
jgi:hypothetical protein